MNWPIRSLLLLSTIGAVTACSGGKQPNGDAQVAAGGSPALTSSQEMSGRSPVANGQELKSLLDSVIAEAKKLPRTDFDPAALAAQLGTDPEAHFVWVRDHTWWAPYLGLLRGAQGVLLDRVGSNLDRAVLLGSLLRNAGQTVRLAHAKLPGEKARMLLSKVRAIPDQRLNSMLGANVPPDPLSDAAMKLVSSQADQLYASVRDTTRSADATEDRAAVSAMADHWWVERKQGDQWVPMDVLLPDGKPGSVVASASEVFDWSAQSRSPSISSSDWHSVQVRVVVERLQDGALSESTVLDTVLRPAEVIDRPITLIHMPKPWPDLWPDISKDPNALGNAAVSVKEWVPVLQVGTDVIAQSGFTDSGEMLNDPLAAKNDVAKVAGGSLFGGLDTALAGGETPTSYMTAEWIDYEIRVPGQPPQRLRRPVFDLLGPTKRSAKISDYDGSTNELLVARYQALLGIHDIFLQPCELTGDFVASLAAAGILSSETDLRELSKEHDPARARDLATAIGERLGTLSPLHTLALWRSSLSQEPADWFIDRPNVLNYRVEVPVVSADHVAPRQVIDIASNSVGVRRGAGRNSFEVRLRQGVADTVAELATLDNDLRMAANTASLFAANATNGRFGVLLVSRDQDQVKQLDWPVDAASRLEEDLAAGFVALGLPQAVALEGHPRTAWWRVEPKSGETIGVMDNGLHAATSEDSITRARAVLEDMKIFMKKNARHVRMVRQQAGYGNPSKAMLKEADLYKRIANLIKEVDAMGGL